MRKKQGDPHVSLPKTVLSLVDILVEEVEEIPPVVTRFVATRMLTERDVTLQQPAHTREEICAKAFQPQELIDLRSLGCTDKSAVHVAPLLRLCHSTHRDENRSGSTEAYQLMLVHWQLIPVAIHARIAYHVASHPVVQVLGTDIVEHLATVASPGRSAA